MKVILKEKESKAIEKYKMKCKAILFCKLYLTSYYYKGT